MCSSRRAPLELGQPRLEDAHRGRLVLQLRALVLTRDDDAGRQVRDPHGGVGRVDPLAAGTARAVDVDPKVRLVDLDLLGLGLVERGDHVERRERRVAPLLRVERADPDEPVDAALGRQQPVGVVPVHGERRRLDARLVAVVDLVDVDVEAIAAPPTARTSAAACRPNPCDSVPPAPAWTVAIASCASYGPDEQRLELARRSRSTARAPSTGARELGGQVGVVGVAEELVDRDRVVELALQVVEPIELGVQPRELGGDTRGPCAGSSHSDGSAACCWSVGGLRALRRRRQRNPRAACTRSAIAVSRSVYSLIAHECTGGIARRRKPLPARASQDRMLGNDMETTVLDTLLLDAEADLRSLVVIDKEPVTWLLIEAPGAARAGRPRPREAIEQMAGTVAQDPRHGEPWRDSRTPPPRSAPGSRWPRGPAPRSAAPPCRATAIGRSWCGATLAELPDLLGRGRARRAVDRASSSRRPST